MQKNTRKGAKIVTAFGYIVRIEDGKRWEGGISTKKGSKSKYALTDIKIRGESREAVMAQIEQLLAIYPLEKERNFKDLSGYVANVERW
ncbi:MAG: hypothetical protein Q4C58_11035 [Eubacteriales bacterium]|nr:hypothetical protein [Eubacteriales bacterium]